MKTLARWFFLWTHHDEYVEAGSYIKTLVRSDKESEIDNAVGAIEVLGIFNMLKD